MMPLETLYASAAVFVGALVALLVYHLAVARPAFGRLRHSLELHDGLIAGDGGGAAEHFRRLDEAQARTGSALQALTARVTALEALAGTDLSRAGFVRYDAFTEGESGLSYALALLNRQGDGVVLTSIYSRADTRTFGKPVSNFKPTVQASAEELEAIERARMSTPETSR
jgi:hypothetical protein